MWLLWAGHNKQLHLPIVCHAGGSPFSRHCLGHATLSFLSFCCRGGELLSACHCGFRTSHLNSKHSQVTPLARLYSSLELTRVREESKELVRGFKGGFNLTPASQLLCWSWCWLQPYLLGVDHFLSKTWQNMPSFLSVPQLFAAVKWVRAFRELHSLLAFV